MLLKPLDGIVPVSWFQFGFFNCLMERLDGAIISLSTENGVASFQPWGKLNLAGSFQRGLARPNQELFCLNSHGGAEPP